MLKIPYVPAAYPNETFGSLLTRLLLHNGKGLWRSLLEESGYGRRTVSSFYAIPVKDKRLDFLLESLGYSYQEMLYQLTVLPFWLSFNNAIARKLQIQLNRVDGSNTQLYSVGRRYALAGARFCPACLIDDVQTWGEPYLHRQHQLPVALVCAKHGEGLRLTCRACGITVLPFNRALLRPLSLRCQCSQDLSATTGARSARWQNFQRLSQFAESALFCTDAPWTVQQVRTVLQLKMNVKQRDFRREALKLFESAYGPIQSSKSSSTLSLQLLDFEEVPLRLRMKFEEFHAPEFCALLSATGLTFEEFNFASTMVNATPELSTRVILRSFTIEQARSEFERLSLEYHERAAREFRRHHKRWYWLLRLRDSAWLRDRGFVSNMPIPSIAADRIEIIQRLRNCDCIRYGLYGVSSWMRASIRDKPWLDARLEERRSNPFFAETRAQKAQHERTIALSRALFTVLRTEQRPARIHAGLLSEVAGISMGQAQRAIAKSQPLKLLIAAINAGKNRRMAAWAAQMLVSTGKQLTARNVLRCAGLNTTKINRQLAVIAIEKLGVSEP